MIVSECRHAAVCISAVKCTEPLPACIPGLPCSPAAMHFAQPGSVGWSLLKTSGMRPACLLQHALDQEAANQQRLHKAWDAPLGTTSVEPADLGLHPPDTAETQAQRQQELEAVLAEVQALTGLPISLVGTQGEALPAPAAAG